MGSLPVQIMLLLKPVRAKFAFVVTTALLCLSVLPAHAQNHRGIYLGVGAGVVEDQGLDLDESGTSLRLGYEFNQLLSAELGYLEIFDRDESEDSDIDSWSASLVMTYPLTLLDVYGKLGAMYVENGESSFNRFEQVNAMGSRGFAALGAQVNLGKFDLYGEYTRVDGADSEDVELFSAGFRIRF